MFLKFWKIFYKSHVKLLVDFYKLLVKLRKSFKKQIAQNNVLWNFHKVFVVEFVICEIGEMYSFI